MSASSAGRPLTPGEGAVPSGTLITILDDTGTPVALPVESLSNTDRALIHAGTGEAIPIHGIHRAAPASPGFAVHIRADALAPGVPTRDLVLPPDGLVMLDDSADLVPAAALLNSASVTRTNPPDLWWTIDLGSHAVIRANGTAIGTARLPPSPDAARPHTCIPILPPGDALNDHRKRIALRAAEADLPIQANPPPPYAPQPLPKPAPPPDPITIVAAGNKITLAEPEPLAFTCTLPARTGPVRIRSTPRRAADPSDTRPFGVCLTSVKINGAHLDFAAPIFGPGFHPPETDTLTTWRWTNGDAWLVLPYSSEPRALEVVLTNWHHALATA